jgi:hypothetical protein
MLGDSSISGATRVSSLPSVHEEHDLHFGLATWNRHRLAPVLDAVDPERELAQSLRMQRLELRFVERERAFVAERAADAPTEPEAFVHWFEALEHNGPGQYDALFPWLAERASLEQMCWFLRQEMAGEAGFEDLVALTQVKLPVRAKLELARNYWDEMGQGHRSGMHGPLLERLGRSLALPPAEAEATVETLALGNLMIALATHRGYAFQSIGALGVIELTAPGRAERVNAGLKRLGVTGEARRYYALHATLDRKHSAAWNREVLGSLVEEDPRRARAIAEGALMRLRAGARCFERYRRELFAGSRGTASSSQYPSARSVSMPPVASASPMSWR